MSKVRIDNLDHEQALDGDALEAASGGKTVGRGLLKQSDDTLDAPTEESSLTYETSSWSWGWSSVSHPILNRCETVVSEVEDVPHESRSETTVEVER